MARIPCPCVALVRTYVTGGWMCMSTPPIESAADREPRAAKRPRLLDQLLLVRTAGGLSCTEKSVLYTFVTYANPRGEAFPSLATIARGAGVAERTAGLAVASLEAKSVLVRTGEGAKGGRKSARRKLNDEALAALAGHPRSSCAPPPQHVRPTPATAADEPPSNHHRPNRETIQNEPEPERADPSVDPDASTPDPAGAEPEHAARDTPRPTGSGEPVVSCERKKEPIQELRRGMHGMGWGR